MEVNYLGDHLEDVQVFYGPESRPFLAPRGVWLNQSGLFVSDTGRNRVFYWKDLPREKYSRADLILGQNTQDETSRNAGTDISARTLLYPSGLWSDGKKIIVADAWNHRVLVWHTIPTDYGAPADVVIGQPDFNSNDPNVKGLSCDPSAKSLYWPYGVFSNGTSLWIADTGNRRILYFDSIPTKNFSPADKVIGQEDFNSRDFTEENPIWPYSVSISDSGQMAVSDTQFYRTLFWHRWQDSYSKTADIIIGQNSLHDSGANQYRLHPLANTLNWTYDHCFYQDGILINDTGNSRILGFDSIPTKNNAEANWLIGRPDFTTGSEFKGNIGGTDPAIYWPFSICTFQDLLCIADTGNHRVIIGRLKTSI